jgi:hypothetical protein
MGPPANDIEGSRPKSRVRWPAEVIVAACIMMWGGLVFAAELPKGYLDEAHSKPILDKTVTIRLDPDLSQLSAGERRAVEFLLEAGDVFQLLYETSRHRDARVAYGELLRVDQELGHPAATRNLIDLYRLARGPVIRDLDNKIVPILPVEKSPPGRAVYPWGIEKKEIENYLSAHPEERSRILDPRSVVRRRTMEQVASDLAVLSANPVLDMLHPGLKETLEIMARTNSADGLYAIPYSVAYAPELSRVYDLLCKAAAAVEADDPDFAGYLRHRAVDLLRDDYEAGDAAWVTGRFRNLNAQIGSYETYDDGLYGVKSFFGLSVLARDPALSATVSTVKQWLQEMENLLPYEPHKTVKTDIPVDAYNVVADFGQARGTNTATILPNDPRIVRKHGRTILLRDNIMNHPAVFEIRNSAFEAAVADRFQGAYEPKGDFFRTLWHEVGHYLGPDATKSGGRLDAALEEDAPILEELKADLIALYVTKNLYKRGYYNEQRLRSVEAAGIRRVLLKNEPKKAQVYETMQLMQMNYFLEKGLLTYDARSNKLSIDYGQYHGTVESMLGEVLALQLEGDKQKADAFIAAYSTWEAKPHESLADAMKGAESYRYVLVRFAALGE